LALGVTPRLGRHTTFIPDAYGGKDASVTGQAWRMEGARSGAVQALYIAEFQCTRREQSGCHGTTREARSAV